MYEYLGEGRRAPGPGEARAPDVRMVNRRPATAHERRVLEQAVRAQRAAGAGVLAGLLRAS